MASANVQTSYDSHDCSPTSSANESRKKFGEIMDECELTWEHIQETHNRLASHKNDKPPVGTDKSNATIKILRHKERRLQAQLDILKNQDVEVISKDFRNVEAFLWDSIKQNVSQLQNALGIVKEQRVEVADDIIREKKMLEEQKAIQESLERKIKVLYKQEDEQQKSSILTELQAKKKEAAKDHLTVMNQLGKFLSDHFPAPNHTDSEDEESGWQTQYCSLQHIIEALMNRLFESPHDCYVKILPTYWAPYIQLLLRSNIIQRHPDNCNLIRLVAFHT
ncbi:centromere protein K-like [Dendronephthya gigantea]|uniref:centromere protein K-like n=1 Tax=Dendronephthya gigantea TaxID=151771 RepID=UPI00106D5E37|nr:centromere protein K-like [Dendronephthya gigantea]